MTPDNDQMHRLLPRYLLGRLDESDVARFRRHLTDCEECRSEKAYLERVQRLVDAHGAEVFEDHPEPDRLVAHHAGELSDEDAAAIRRHLDACATCALEARWIAGEAVYDRPARTAKAGVWWRRVAAAAAVVLVALAIPVLRRESPPEASFARPQALVGVQRATEAGSVIELRPGESAWQVYFPVDLPDEGFPCAVELLDASGRQVAKTELASRADLVMELYLFLQCDLRTCESGMYAVRLDPAGDVPEETFRFEVRGP